LKYPYRNCFPSCLKDGKKELNIHLQTTRHQQITIALENYAHLHPNQALLALQPSTTWNASSARLERNSPSADFETRNILTKTAISRHYLPGYGCLFMEEREEVCPRLLSAPGQTFYVPRPPEPAL